MLGDWGRTLRPARPLMMPVSTAASLPPTNMQPVIIRSQPMHILDCTYAVKSRRLDFSQEAPRTGGAGAPL